MAATFDETLLDPLLMRKRAEDKYPVTATLEFANQQPRNGMTAIRKTNVGRLDATENIQADLSMLEDDDREYFVYFLRGGQGSGVGFRAWMPHDHSLDMEAIAVGDGVVSQFRITKTYYRPGVAAHPDVRRIFKPVIQVAKEQNSYQLLQPRTGAARVPGAYTPNWFDRQFRVYFDATEQTANWKVDCKTGILYLTGAAIAASSGKTIKVDGVFDTPVCFDGNQFTQLFDVPSGAQYSFREMLGGELGIT